MSPFNYSTFFFSSRRRHTRWPRDWSSDVCSSDLAGAAGQAERDIQLGEEVADHLRDALLARDPQPIRSEERRVGKEGRCRWWKDLSKKTADTTRVVIHHDSIAVQR